LLRQAIAEKYSPLLNYKIDPETEVTVTCGSTEAMVASMLALVDPDDEVIVFEPHYENYGPDAILSGARPKYVKMHPPEWKIDEKELEQAFSNKTRAIIINSPHNPTGKVFTRQELELVAKLCQKWGVLALTDEIYEHILYDGHEHISIGSLAGMENLTVTTNSLSKTFSITGWRVGWAIASKELSLPIRKVHDFLTIGSPAPLQRAGVTAIKSMPKYYAELKDEYNERRAHMLGSLDIAGVPYFKPQGAYYVFCDISGFGYGSDLDFMKHLVEKIGIAVVPGSSFFGPWEISKNYVRFCFSRQLKTLNETRERLKYLMKAK
ncbi:MAG TPA: aminotransferase class I/II-fold pyridoxal phosphate-dependent enzyme, partial [Chroococcales cyanobacterium]